MSIILIERYIRYEMYTVLFLSAASRIGVVPVEVNLCFAHDWPFEFISVQQVVWRFIYNSNVPSSFRETAVADRVKPREQFVYYAYELCDTRVLTRARMYTRHRDGRNVVNVSHVSRPYLCMCVPLTYHASCSRVYACVSACVSAYVTCLCVHEYVFHTRIIDMHRLASFTAVYKAIF